MYYVQLFDTFSKIYCLLRKRYYLKYQPIVNSKSEAEDNNDVLVESMNKVIQDSVHYIEYIMLLGNIFVYL